MARRGSASPARATESSSLSGGYERDGRSLAESRESADSRAQPSGAAREFVPGERANAHERPMIGAVRPRNVILCVVSLALTALGAISLARAATPRPATPATARAGVFVGRIAAKGRTVVDPGDGTKLVLTRLTLRGTRLANLGSDGPPPPDEELEVWFRGGVVSEDLGSFVADAPAEHETRVGRWSVVRHRWSENLGILEDGTALAGEALEGGRAGLFTAFVSTDGALIVQGRPGTQIGRNVPSSALQRMIPAGSR